MRPLIAGNWKMHGTTPQPGEITAMAAAVRSTPAAAGILICPPSTLITRAVPAASGEIAIGGQNCAAEISGAYTGDLSAEMLKDSGAAWVIIGHSERREHHGETDAMVAAKAKAVWRAGLQAVSARPPPNGARGMRSAYVPIRSRAAYLRALPHPGVPLVMNPDGQLGPVAPRASMRSRRCMLISVSASLCTGAYRARGYASSMAAPNVKRVRIAADYEVEDYGASVTANKIPGVRSGLIHDVFSAHQGDQDDDINVRLVKISRSKESHVQHRINISSPRFDVRRVDSLQSFRNMV